jgi:hypothetical protein
MFILLMKMLKSGEFQVGSFIEEYKKQSNLREFLFSEA